MPTYERTARFGRDLKRLTSEQRDAFKAAVADFIADLKVGENKGEAPRFRRNLRVKGVEGLSGVFEMSWAPDGRATFQYGRPRRRGQIHVIWRRVGTHDLFRRP